MNLADVRKFYPCYDPIKWYGEDDEFLIMNVLESKNIPAEDKVWLATRNGILPDIVLRRFAIWCARSRKTDSKEVADYIDATEGYYIHNTHSKEQMTAAYRAAYQAAYLAAYQAAYRAAYRAAYQAAYLAAYWAAYRADDMAIVRAGHVATLIKLIKEGV